MADLSEQDKDALAYTILGEGDNQPLQGQAAIAHVALNRLRSGKYGDSLAKIVQDPSQFEAWARHPPQMGVSQSSPQFQNARAIVDATLNGSLPDPTGGATQFFAPKAQMMLGRSPPAWTVGAKPTAVIGDHMFYTPVKEQTQAEMDPLDLAKHYSKPLPGGPVGAPQGAPTPKALQDRLGAGTGPDPDPSDLVTRYSKPLDTGAQTVKAPPSGLAAGDDDSMLGTAGKAIGTYAAKAFAQVPGLPGNLRDTGKLAAAAAIHLQTGKPISEILPQMQGPKWLEALHSGPEVEQTLLGPGGAYEPTSGLGRAAMATAPAIGSAVSMGAGSGPALTGAALSGGVGEGVTDFTKNPALGMGAGMLTALLTGRMMAGGATQANTVVRGLADRAINHYGIPLDAGDIAGQDSNLSRLLAMAGKIPGGGGNAAYNAKTNAWTQRVLETTGGDAQGNIPEYPTKDFLTGAQGRIGNAMSRIENRNTVAYDPQLTQELGNIRTQAGNMLAPDDPIMRQLNGIENIAAANNGQVPGRAFQDYMRMLQPLASQGTPYGEYARNISRSLQSAWERSVPQNDQDIYAQANSQYYALKRIEPLVVKGTPGELNPPALAGQMKNYRSYPGSPENLDNLDELASIGQLIKQPKSSGTAENQSALDLLKTPARLATLGAAGLVGGRELGLDPAMLLNPTNAAILGTAGVAGGLGTSALARGIGAYGRNPLLIDQLLSGSRAPNLLGQGAAGALPAIAGYDQ